MSTTGGRYALIVAVANYYDSKFQQLRAPAADADRLAAALGAPAIGDFEVDVTRDEEEPHLRRRIARFFANRVPEDVLLLHFSCHGVKDDRGTLYLAAPDTEIDLLDATGISAGWLNEQIDRSRSRRILLLLDCCFSGAFPLGMRSRAGDRVNVEEHLGGRGRAVISASNSMEYSYEGEQLTGEAQPSIFSEAVAEALETGRADRDQDKWISVDELYDYVYDRVKEKTPSQTPIKMGNVEGSFLIARSVYEAPIEPVPLDPHLVALIESPIPGARLGAIDELSRLLASSNRAVQLSARQTLESLLEDDSRRVSEMAADRLAAIDQKTVTELEQKASGSAAEPDDAQEVFVEEQKAIRRRRPVEPTSNASPDSVSPPKPKQPSVQPQEAESRAAWIFRHRKPLYGVAIAIVIVGILILLFWSIVLGFIVILVGLIAFGGFARGR
jgi:Caspase domain